MKNHLLTQKQKEVLVTFKELVRANGISPTLDEIRKVMGYSQTSSVQRHIKPLIQKGYLENDSNKTRGLKIVEEKEEIVSLPLVGNISCGCPLYAEENIEAYIPYPKNKIRFNSEELFFLRATGDSMNKANINSKNIEDGDYLLIRKQSTANLGIPVVALIGGEATVKYFQKDNKSTAYILNPKSTNKSHKPILLFDEFYIQGVVVDVLKSK